MTRTFPRRTFGLGMSAVALSLLGAERDEGHTMTAPDPKPPKDPDPDRKPYDDPNLHSSGGHSGA